MKKKATNKNKYNTVVLALSITHEDLMEIEKDCRYFELNRSKMFRKILREWHGHKKGYYGSKEDQRRNHTGRLKKRA